MRHITLASIAASLALSLPACSQPRVHDANFKSNDISCYIVKEPFGLHYVLIAHKNGAEYVVGIVHPDLNLRKMIVYHPGTAIVTKKPIKPSIPVSFAYRGFLYHSEERPFGFLEYPLRKHRFEEMKIPEPIKSFILAESYYK